MPVHSQVLKFPWQPGLEMFVCLSQSVGECQPEGPKGIKIENLGLSSYLLFKNKYYLLWNYFFFASLA
jgi:hypothetical protein